MEHVQKIPEPASSAGDTCSKIGGSDSAGFQVLRSESGWGHPDGCNEWIPMEGARMKDGISLLEYKVQQNVSKLKKMLETLIEKPGNKNILLKSLKQEARLLVKILFKNNEILKVISPNVETIAAQLVIVSSNLYSYLRKNNTDEADDAATFVRTAQEGVNRIQTLSNVVFQHLRSGGSRQADEDPKIDNVPTTVSSDDEEVPNKEDKLTDDEDTLQDASATDSESEVKELTDDESELYIENAPEEESSIDEEKEDHPEAVCISSTDASVQTEDFVIYESVETQVTPAPSKTMMEAPTHFPDPDYHECTCIVHDFMSLFWDP